MKNLVVEYVLSSWIFILWNLYYDMFGRKKMIMLMLEFWNGLGYLLWIY